MAVARAREVVAGTVGAVVRAREEVAPFEGSQVRGRRLRGGAGDRGEQGGVRGDGGQRPEGTVGGGAGGVQHAVRVVEGALHGAVHRAGIAVGRGPSEGVGEHGGAEVRVDLELGGGQAERQRQARARLDQPGERRLFPVRRCAAGEGHEQDRGICVRQRAQVDVDAAVGDQAGQVTGCGDHHRAAGGGKKVAHQGAVVRPGEQHRRAAGRAQGPPQALGLVEPLGDQGAPRARSHPPRTSSAAPPRWPGTACRSATR